LANGKGRFARLRRSEVVSPTETAGAGFGAVPATRAALYGAAKGQQ